MSFVNAAKEAMDDYLKNNPPEKQTGKKNLPPLSSNPAQDVWNERTGGFVVTPQMAQDIQIRQAAEKAEAIFNPSNDVSNNPNHISNKWKNSLNSLVSGAQAAFDAVAGSDGSTPSTGTSAKPVIYSDWSPTAQYFGMDQQTAYSEHMANTAHQREVADLRAAGLNPVLGLGSGASGVSGSVAASGGSSAEKTGNGDFIVDAIGATAAVVTALITKNPSYGYMAGSAVNSIGDLLTKNNK